ncbi:MAG: Hpt domain-containing protein [Longimicrobiales bacterium]|nr:Hpt domain-containing protein [Longimicrobiales bacterium]
MHDKPVVDAAALDRLREWGGDNLVDQMVRLYIENARSRLEQIDAGLSGEGEMRVAEMAAHSLKSSAANVGAMRVSAQSALIEDAAASGDIDAVRTLRDLLAREIADAEREIRTLVPESEE